MIKLKKYINECSSLAEVRTVRKGESAKVGDAVKVTDKKHDWYNKTVYITNMEGLGTKEIIVALDKKSLIVSSIPRKSLTKNA